MLEHARVRYAMDLCQYDVYPMVLEWFIMLCSYKLGCALLFYTVLYHNRLHLHGGVSHSSAVDDRPLHHHGLHIRLICVQCKPYYDTLF